MRLSREKRMKSGDRLPPFVPIFKEEMDSKAFLKLTPSTIKVLIYMRWAAGVVKKKTGDSAAAFHFTYEETERLGIARRTFSRALQQLVDKGFIDIVYQGGLRGSGRSNSRYRMSDRWRLYGLPGFVKKPRYQSEP